MAFEKSKKYFQLAKYNADLFSKDPNTKVGAIILSNDFSRIQSTGINGFPRSFNDKIEKRWERPTKYLYVSHAEVNAICNAARSGTALDNSILVVTMFPCMNCTKAIIQAGIKKLYTKRPNFTHPRWGEDFKISKEMLDEVGVEIFYIDEEGA
jgi:dCMP deaminase